MPYGSGFEEKLLNKTGSGLASGVGAGPEAITHPPRSFVFPGNRNSRRGALPQRILR